MYIRGPSVSGPLLLLLRWPGHESPCCVTSLSTANLQNHFYLICWIINNDFSFVMINFLMIHRNNFYIEEMLMEQILGFGHDLKIEVSQKLATR